MLLEMIFVHNEIINRIWVLLFAFQSNESSSLNISSEIFSSADVSCTAKREGNNMFVMRTDTKNAYTHLKLETVFMKLFNGLSRRCVMKLNLRI